MTTAKHVVLETAFTVPNQHVYYITENATRASLRYADLLQGLRDEELLFTVETRPVYTVVLVNGTEVTFIPESEAHKITLMPPALKIFIEQSQSSNDIASLVGGNSKGVVFINPETKEVL